jgi:predicted O-methyltransferase YrrM
MKAKLDAIIQRNQAEYLDQLLTQKDPLLAEMEAYAAEHKVPIADREVARFLEITARASGARKVLEIGMAIGYSVVHLAHGVGAQVLDRVEIEKGKALEVMPSLEETFDLLFIDAVKEEYSQYLDLGLPRLRTGGVVIVDNLLWGGMVATGDTESSTVALREFNRYFLNHPQLLAEVLPVGDGLGYAVKIS